MQPELAGGFVTRATLEVSVPTFPLLVWLSLATLVIVLVVAFFQLKRVRQSQEKRGETPGGIAGPSGD